MENKIPACIRCQTRTFMVRERSGQKAGALLGATFGMGAAYGSIKLATGLATLMLLSLAPASGLAAALGAGPAPIMFSRLIMAALSASMTGSVIGQQIDSRIRMRYRCNRCGCVVQG